MRLQDWPFGHRPPNSEQPGPAEQQRPGVPLPNSAVPRHGPLSSVSLYKMRAAPGSSEAPRTTGSRRAGTVAGPAEISQSLALGPPPGSVLLPTGALRPTPREIRLVPRGLPLPRAREGGGPPGHCSPGATSLLRAPQSSPRPGVQPSLCAARGQACSHTSGGTHHLLLSQKFVPLCLTLGLSLCCSSAWEVPAHCSPGHFWLRI